MTNLSQFKLNKVQLVEIKNRFSQDHGLGNYSSYLHLDKKTHTGEYIAIELGGTNLRAARITLSDSKPVIGDIISGEVPCTQNRCTPEEFYTQIIEQIKPVLTDNTPIGITFSFATLINRDLDAKLLYWTKDIKVPELVGKYVGVEFNKALSMQGYKAPRIVLLNDTVATMLAATSFQPAACVVVGTGINIAVLDHDNQIINTECGNLEIKDLSIRTQIDEKVDDTSSTPGSYSLEKMISGKYLPRIYNKLTKSNIKSTQLMVSLMQEGDEVASLLFTRSAQLIGAILASALEKYNKPTVVAEGSVFWEVPEYKETVVSTIYDLIEKEVKFIKVDNPGLIGAAIAVGLSPIPTGGEYYLKFFRGGDRF